MGGQVHRLHPLCCYLVLPIADILSLAAIQSLLDIWAGVPANLLAVQPGSELKYVLSGLSVIDGGVIPIRLSTAMSRRMEKPIAVDSVDDGHNPFLSKLGQNRIKIVPFKVVSNLRESEFRLQGMTIPR